MNRWPVAFLALLPLVGVLIWISWEVATLNAAPVAAVAPTAPPPLVITVIHETTIRERWIVTPTATIRPTRAPTATPRPLPTATVKAAWDWWRTPAPAATKDHERRDPWALLADMSEDNERLRRENAALKGGGA